MLLISHVKASSFSFSLNSSPYPAIPRHFCLRKLVGFFFFFFLQSSPQSEFCWLHLPQLPEIGRCRVWTELGSVSFLARLLHRWCLFPIGSNNNVWMSLFWWSCQPLTLLRSAVIKLFVLWVHYTLKNYWGSTELLFMWILSTDTYHIRN